MRFFCVFITTIMLLVFAVPAEAHANLVRSEPKVGSTVAQAPTVIELEFGEDLDPAFSHVQLFDSTNTLRNPGPGQIDGQNPRILRLTPGALANGTYTAIWRVRSAADGHVTEGSVPFGVGTAVALAALIPPLGTPDPATLAPPPVSSAIRWLSLLGAIIMLGTLPFVLFIWRPGFAAAQREAAQVKVKNANLVNIDSYMRRVLRRLLLLGSGILLIASGAFIIDQAAQAAGVGYAQALGQPTLQLLASRTGLLVLARCGLVLALALLALRLPAPGSSARWPWWLGLGMGAALLATFSLNSHGAAEPTGALLATLLDWLHLAATAGWIGGLLPLAAVLWAARRGKDQSLPIGQIIPRFSLLAVVCVVTLAGSGVYSYFLHVGSLPLLADTTYGRALMIKLALFGLLVLFGGWNLLILSPGLRRPNTSLARSFGRTVSFECILGALVLLAAGAMTSVAPSKVAWAQQEQLGLVREANAANVQMRLQVAPAQIGDNEFAVDLHDTRPAANAKPAKVLLRFKMEGMAMGELQTELTPTDSGRYLARGSYLSMGGRWQVELVLRRAGFEDVQQQFVLDVVKAAR